MILTRAFCEARVVCVRREMAGTLRTVEVEYRELQGGRAGVVYFSDSDHDQQALVIQGRGAAGDE